MLNQDLEQKELELQKLQREVAKMRHTRSEWSRANSSYYNHSDAGTVRSQLDSISKELDDEKKKTKNVISKQVEELEEYKKQRED